MPSKKRKVGDYPQRQVTLSCGCKPIFTLAPPQLGNTITCRHHGEATVTKTIKEVNLERALTRPGP